jgi:HEAT repeat protein
MEARDAMTTTMSTKTTTALLILAALLLSPALEAAAQDLPQRETVEQALIGIHDLADKKSLSSLGPGVDVVLQKIVTHPSHRALARTRAISALQHFPSAAARAVLLAVIKRGRKLTKPSLALLDLERAAVSYAVVAGPAGLPELQRLLTHANLDVRGTAAQAVRLTRHPRAEALLTGRLKRDSSATVRHAIKRQLELLRQKRRKTR